MRMDALSALILLTGFAGSPVMAQRTDISGTWNLNVAKSFMGSEHPSSDYRLTRTIEEKNGRLSIKNTSVHATVAGISLPDTTTTMEFAADGKEYVMKLPSMFPGIPEMSGKVSAGWEGCTLQVHEEIAAFGSATKERMFLTEDRSQLIVLVEGHSTFMDTEQRLVFEKKD
jgi:hypothetical protein